MNCVAPFDFVEITNIGDNEISLAGFGLRSGKGSSSGIEVNLVQEQHLGLEGHLKPGERILVPGEAARKPARSCRSFSARSS